MAAEPSSPARLEAFSDGVIAVIITIMVLELHVPTANGVAGLVSILPTLAVYLLSFAFTGVYWMNHHHLVHRTDRADSLILYTNLLFLFFLSLLPFFTNYVLEKKEDSFSVGLYVVSMILTSVSFLMLRLAIGRHLRRTGKLGTDDRVAERKHWISIAMYVAAIALSPTHPRFALGIVALVSVLWIIPTARIASPLECTHELTDSHSRPVG